MPQHIVAFRFAPRIAKLLVGTAACAAALSGQEVRPGYGPAPYLPAPDTTHRATRLARVVGWPTGVTPTAPAKFSVTLWAAGLHSPRWVHVLPNADVLVVESSNPGTPRDWRRAPEELAAWYATRIRGVSANRITILRDTSGDGNPDIRSILLSGLNQPLGVVALGGFLYVANTDALLRYPYAPGQLEITAPAERVIELPAGGYNNHWTRNVVARPDGRKLYVSVGSATNVDLEGIDAKDPRRAAILELEPDGRAMRVFASGLRNPVGMAWEPVTGALWAAVNERDGLGDDLPPDYITRVREGAFYGWPYAYWGTRADPRHAGRRPDQVRRSVTPDFATGAHTATINLLFYSGRRFPARYRGGAFIAQRGSWNRTELAGYRVAFLPFRNGTPAGPMEEFLTGFVVPGGGREVFGRPVGLAELPDGSLLVSDDASNVIWRVRWDGR
jgi:glucose/arabinose dehydrogenase